MDVQPNVIPSNCFILTNSPALHSLKRHQLVQLCKRNGIKATGKNAEIVEKLKAHALNMPADAPLSQKTFSSDDYDKENRRFAMPRPSEQWTVIEEDSREIERVHLGLKDIRKEVQQEMGSMSTLKAFGASQAAGDFGNGTTSSKGSSMSSSIKAFATSLKRTNSKSSTALTPSTKLSTGPSSNIRLPIHTEEPPINDLMTTTTSYHEQQTYPLLPDPEPLDADDSRDQSMLELGTSTIRLVTPNPTAESPPALRPFTPTFALSNSPGSPSVPSLYPTLSVDPDSDPNPPGGFPSMFNTPSATTKTARSPAPPSSPAPLFLFGSPAHRISNTEFNSAATTVLAEMNARLGLTGTSNEVGLELLQNRQGAPPGGLLPRQEKLTTDVKSKFDRAHEREFEKMEGLGTWYAKRGPVLADKPEASAGKKRKSDALGGLGKRPARTSNVRPRGASRVVTPGTRRSLVAAAVAEEDDGRRTKRVRISTADAEGRVHDKAPNVDADPNAMEVDDATQKANEEREKERAAIKKRLEVSRARRRSSMGRVSVGAGRPSLIPNKPKKGIATRFGFLSSAKALVKNVWNKGTMSEAQSNKPIVPTAPKPPPPTSRAVPKNPVPNVLTKAPPIPKPNVVKAVPAKAPTVKPDASTPMVGPSTGFGFGRKLSTHSRPNSALGTKSSLASSAGARSRADSTVGKKSTTSSSSRTRANSVSSATSLIPSVRRGPIPPFQPPVGRMMRTNSLVNGGTVQSRTSTVSSRGGSVGKPGSTGGKKSPLAADTSAGSSKIGRQRASTLFAPTASSLARMQSTVRPRSMSGAGNSTAAPVDGSGLARVPEQQTTPPRKVTPTEIPTFTFTSPPPVGGAPIPSNVTGSIFTNAPSTLFPPPNSAESSTAPKPRALPQRRPRISRSRVIARLGAQRAVSGSSMNSNASSRRSLGVSKPRGSLSARASGVGVKDRRKEVAAAMSARKRLRQSEILRRRSRVVGSPPSTKHMKNDSDKTFDDDEDDDSQDDDQQDDDKQDDDKRDYANDYGNDVNERYEEPNTTTDVSMGD